MRRGMRAKSYFSLRFLRNFQGELLCRFLLARAVDVSAARVRLESTTAPECGCHADVKSLSRDCRSKHAWKIGTPRASAMILPVPSHSHRSHFITFEGLDGCGKST